MWSVGAFLEQDDRVKMEEFLRSHDIIQLDLPPKSSSTESTMFDYMVESIGKHCARYKQNNVKLYTVFRKKEPHYLDYNSRIFWSIFIILAAVETGMNTL